MKIILFILFISLFSNSYSQFGPQQIISTEAETARDADAVDIDGDGDKDIVVACRTGNFNIAWFENLDGEGNFGIPNIIATNLFDQSYSITAADLDGDGDFDVITTAASADRVLWYENLDGLGSFGTQRIITGNADGAFSAIAVDVDGDGDNDVISASDVSGLAWYENLDGLGTFSALKIIRDFTVYANMIFVADADGDGDMDVFSASNGDNEVAWQENIDGLGNFGPKNVITVSLPHAFAVYAADLDNDGDMDVLATGVETFGGEVVWFENLDGAGTYSDKQTISTEVQSPRSVLAADIDNDGDMDVVGSSQNDDKIAWYENQTIMGIAENAKAMVSIYPNPTKATVYIETTTETLVGATLFDVLGKEVIKLLGDIREVDVSGLESGIYFLWVATDSGETVQKLIKE
ncbi:T9SS type A sorting domain-containing protein [Aequorivita vladivostokensis]|uniref:Secretion system C-terminal sorting domain-containing protein n=1 Tax=Aequorivita vladivostokensis TaxID=171194 RepID=A0ABR5DIF0_9FLAO|nr:T9SS type A sorting domain-containing protein [Aequorivita vladivostokensis]KJJ38554.1 hypothetical protein MB09_07635 [Aequorivita vladivostokensis]